MADWATISSLATAGGTLVLAAATFAAVRSSNRSARVAEQSLLAGLRPVLVSSRFDAPAEKVRFADDPRWFQLPGVHAVLESEGGVIFMLMGIRNVGTGLGVLRAWRIESRILYITDSGPPPLESFRTQIRDIYVPAGDTGFWQGAIRDPEDPDREGVLAAITNREGLTIDLLYGDGEGGQRVISRFLVTPAVDEAWLSAAGKHWNLDRADPR